MLLILLAGLRGTLVQITGSLRRNTLLPWLVVCIWLEIGIERKQQVHSRQLRVFYMLELSPLLSFLVAKITQHGAVELKRCKQSSLP